MKNLIQLIKSARFVFVCGNGGSSATAEHLTSDLFSKGIKAICLNSNVSIMTMIANDYGYKYVFLKQLELYANKDDLLIVISGSGNSENILYALGGPLERLGEYKTLALLGMGGGDAKDLADFSMVIDSDDYGVIENGHLEIVHKIKDAL